MNAVGPGGIRFAQYRQALLQARQRQFAGSVDSGHPEDNPLHTAGLRPCPQTALGSQPPHTTCRGGIGRLCLGNPLAVTVTVYGAGADIHKTAWPRLFIQCVKEPGHARIVGARRRWRGKIENVATAGDTRVRQRHIVKIALPHSDPGCLQLCGTGSAAYQTRHRLSRALQALRDAPPDITTADN